jgi:hypothetical protein
MSEVERIIQKIEAGEVRSAEELLPWAFVSALSREAKRKPNTVKLGHSRTSRFAFMRFS